MPKTGHVQQIAAKIFTMRECSLKLVVDRLGQEPDFWISERANRHFGDIFALV